MQAIRPEPTNHWPSCPSYHTTNTTPAPSAPRRHLHLDNFTHLPRVADHQSQLNSLSPRWSRSLVWERKSEHNEITMPHSNYILIDLTGRRQKRARCTPSTRNNGSENKAPLARESRSPTPPPQVSRPVQLARTRQNPPASAARSHYTQTGPPRGACKTCPRTGANDLHPERCRAPDHR